MLLTIVRERRELMRLRPQLAASLILRSAAVLCGSPSWAALAGLSPVLALLCFGLTMGLPSRA